MKKVSIAVASLVTGVLIALGPGIASSSGTNEARIVDPKDKKGYCLYIGSYELPCLH